MSLFKNLAALIAKGADVQITVSAADNGQLEVGFIPTSSSGKTGMNLVAKSFVATPEALDAEFPAVVAGYVNVNVTLADQLSSMQAQADAIAEQAKVNAKSAEKAVGSVAKSVVPQKKSVAASASSDVLEANTGVGAQDIGMTTATPGASGEEPLVASEQVTFSL